MCCVHSGLSNSIWIRLGPAAESIVKMWGCQMCPPALLVVCIRECLALKRFVGSCFVNGIQASKKSLAESIRIH